MRTSGKTVGKPPKLIDDRSVRWAIKVRRTGLNSSHDDADWHKSEEHDQERQLAEGYQAERQTRKDERGRARPMREQQADAGRHREPGGGGRTPAKNLLQKRMLRMAEKQHARR